jgi:Flp pilus assembly secretin CpaC
MKSLPLQALRPPAWRRFGSALALAASLGFAFQSTLVMAQATIEADAPTPASPPKPKPKVAKKPGHKVMPSDNVADELNRREGERVAKLAQQPAAATATPSPAPAAATPTSASSTPAAAVPTPLPAKGWPMPMTAVMPAGSIVNASLTPTVSTPPLGSAAGAPTAQPVPVMPLATTSDPTPSAPQPRQAQAQLPVPAPVPTPVPPSTTSPAPPAVIGGAPTRQFAQSQVVPPQQPTLSLEVQKGTAIKLPGPATTVFVAAPDIADVQVKSPTMIYVFAKKPGDTVLYATDDQDRVLLNTIVSVSSPVSRMKQELDRLHPGNAIQIDNQGESIVLSGVVRSALAAEDARRIALQQVGGKADKVVNNIKVDAPNQVQLRVKIAEVERDSLKRVGINWQNIQSIALFGLGVVRGGFATSTIQSVGGTSSAAIGITSNDGSLTGLIDLLATQSEAHILAEPTLVAMSGETATFLAGGEIPVITPQSGTLTGTITVQYKQVGVSLSFTPTIVGDRINLKVAPEVR